MFLGKLGSFQLLGASSGSLSLLSLLLSVFTEIDFATELKQSAHQLSHCSYGAPRDLEPTSKSPKALETAQNR